MAIQSANYSTRATRSVQRRRGSLWYLLNKRKRREGWRCIGKQTPYSTRHDFISCLSVIACCCCCCSSSSSSSEKRREVKRGAQDKEMRVLLLLRHCLTVYEWCTRHGTIAAVAEASLYIVLSLSLSGWLLTLNDDERWCTLCIIVYGTTRGILSSLYFLLMFNITRKIVVGEHWVSWDEDHGSINGPYFRVVTVLNSGYCGEPPMVANARHNAPQEQSSFALDTELQYQCCQYINKHSHAHYPHPFVFIIWHHKAAKKKKLYL